MLDFKKIPTYISKDIQERGYSQKDISNMSVEKAFSEYCEWQGLIGYGRSLLNVVRELEEAAK